MKHQARTQAGKILLMLVAAMAVMAVVAVPFAAVCDEYQAEDTLTDWILGSDFGIISGEIDTDQKNVVLMLPAEKLENLTEENRGDIESAVNDILGLYYEADVAAEYEIVFMTEDDGTAVEPITDGAAETETEDSETEEGAAQEADEVNAEIETDEVVNLIFIHHSCGENWLNDGLCRMLNDNGYHVADISYGWREYGDYTDTTDWPMWFTDEVMQLVYAEMDAMTTSNTVSAADGENGIIMFKSCYPNSDVGSSIADEKEIYKSLLTYFEQHADKMFVLVTPPPMISISYPSATRELCDWLTDRENGWLSELETENVYVFDLYNVLTHPDAHHQMMDGVEVHISIDGADTLYYDSDGDDHPNQEGNIKATEEFIGLLNYWYASFSAVQTP